eukprot:TRINITY_DN10619_c0_g1_i1.p1 TRINITY_DN10619_c0_g1~~TRINITY_DN10619_c0_g1_i1.p1  ORF type:complete len:517 (+),score=131.22 TRINITY_DN10619_c0_g1_i1:47-1597(+)
MADEDSVETALLVWVRLFDKCDDVTEFKQLKSGVHFSRIFSAMYPKCTIRETTENEHSNWMLCQNTVMEVMKRLTVVLKKHSDDLDISDKVDAQKIAESGDKDEIKKLLKFLLITLPGSRVDVKIKTILVNEYPDDDEVLQVLLMNLYEEYDLHLNEHLSDTNGMLSSRRSKASMGSPRRSFYSKPADYERKIEQQQRAIEALKEENSRLWRENAELMEAEAPSTYKNGTDTPLVSPKSPIFDTSILTDALKLKDKKITTLEQELKESQAVLSQKEEELHEALCQEGKRDKGSVKKLKEQRDNLAEENRKLKQQQTKELSNVVGLEKELKNANALIARLQERIDTTATPTDPTKKTDKEVPEAEEIPQAKKSTPDVINTPVTIASPAATEPVGQSDEPEAEESDSDVEEPKGPRKLAESTLDLLQLNQRLKEKNKANRENHINPILQFVTKLKSQTTGLKEMIEQQRIEGLKTQPDYPYHTMDRLNTARVMASLSMDSHRSIHHSIGNSSFSRPRS